MRGAHPALRLRHRRRRPRGEVRVCAVKTALREVLQWGGCGEPLARPWCGATRNAVSERGLGGCTRRGGAHRDIPRVQDEADDKDGQVADGAGPVRLEDRRPLRCGRRRVSEPMLETMQGSG